jgi:hypothetical protein
MREHLAVPGRVTLARRDRGRLVEAIRLPLAKRPGLGGEPPGHGMVLAEPRGGVAVVPQDRADGRGVLLDDRVVAGEAGRPFGDHAEMPRVMSAAADQRGACRGAQRRGVEGRISRPPLSEPVPRRRRDRPAERALGAVTGVVKPDEQHVGGALGRHPPRRPPRRGLGCGVLDLATERRRWRRQRLRVQRFGVCRRARLHRALLPADRDGHEEGCAHSCGDERQAHQ